jgi:hypothetical protein
MHFLSANSVDQFSINVVKSSKSVVSFFIQIPDIRIESAPSSSLDLEVNRKKRRLIDRS